MKTRSLTTKEKAKTVGARKAGLTMGQIAAKLNHPQSTVSTVLANYQKNGTIDPPNYAGRPKKLTDRDR